jgi:hypothetical protein
MVAQGCRTSAPASFRKGGKGAGSLPGLKKRSASVVPQERRSLQKSLSTGTYNNEETLEAKRCAVGDGSFLFFLFFRKRPPALGGFSPGSRSPGTFPGKRIDPHCFDNFFHLTSCPLLLCTFCFPPPASCFLSTAPLLPPALRLWD